jgi:hypothetical protein
MGEFADYANDDQMQSLEELLEYESGNMSDAEAFERGIVGENGELPEITVWGVHDVHSLEAELDRCELALLRLERARKAKQFWVSNGKLYLPHEMTTQHLKNALAYSERNGFKGVIVSQIRDELGRREK